MVLRGTLLQGVEKIQEVLAMEAPESTDPLALCLVAELLDGELLAAETLGKFGKREDLNQLMALHDIVLLDAAALGELLEVHKGQSRESRNVHSEWVS